MQLNLRDAFERVNEGEWICHSPVAIHGPHGVLPVSSGAVYRKGQPILGFDVAEMLDAWHATGHLPPNIRIT